MPIGMAIIPHFSGGEQSPQLYFQHGEPKQAVGLRFCYNAIIDTSGNVSNAPGTIYVADCQTATTLSRLVPFSFNDEQSYVLEFSHAKMRVIKDGALVESGGSPYELATDINSADLQNFDFAAIADTLFILLHNSPIYKITRTADDAWTYVAIDQTGIDGPYVARAEGDELIAVELSHSATTFWNVTSTSAIFGDTDSGDTIKIGWLTPGDISSVSWIWGTVFSKSDSSNILVSFPGSATLIPPTNECVLNWDFSQGDAYWTDVSNDIPDNTRVIYDVSLKQAILVDNTVGKQVVLEQPILVIPDVVYRIRVNVGTIEAGAQININVGSTSWGTDYLTKTGLTTSDTTYSYDFRPTQELIYVSIDNTGSTGTKSSKIDSVSVKKLDLNTYEWRIGAWNDAFGYPQKGVIDGNRLVAARNTDNPQNIWVSELGGFDKFGFHTAILSSDAFDFFPPTRQINGIEWLVNYNGLKAGTADAIWSIFSSTGGGITPTDVNVKLYGGVGSMPLKPVLAEEFLIVASRGEHAVTELREETQNVSFANRPISEDAEHLFKNRRIIHWAYQQNPHKIVWCVLDNGILVGATYIKKYNMWAWHKHETPLGEGYKDVAVIPNSSDPNIDDVYFVINRADVGTTANYYIEKLDTRITPQEAAYGFSASGSPYDYGFLHSSLEVLDAPKTITGITKASPGVVTAVAHGFSNGDLVRIQNVLGMTEVNNQVYKVANKAADTFELNDEDDNDIDTSSFGTYVANGEVRKMITALSGLDHLEGETVTALADGFVESGHVVTGGNITLANAASFVKVGVPYSTVITTHNLEVKASQSATKVVNEANLFLIDTLGAEVSVDDGVNYYPIFADESVEIPPLYTGRKSVYISSNPETEKRITIRQSDPYPITISRIEAILEVNKQ